MLMQSLELSPVVQCVWTLYINCPYKVDPIKEGRKSIRVPQGVRNACLEGTGYLHRVIMKECAGSIRVL